MRKSKSGDLLRKLLKITSDTTELPSRALALLCHVAMKIVPKNRLKENRNHDSMLFYHTLHFCLGVSLRIQIFPEIFMEVYKLHSLVISRDVLCIM